MVIGWLLNTFLLTGITLNYMLMGVSFAAVFANLVTQERLEEVSHAFSPIVGISLLAAIEDAFDFKFEMKDVVGMKNVGEMLDIIERETA